MFLAFDKKIKKTLLFFSCIISICIHGCLDPIMPPNGPSQVQILGDLNIDLSTVLPDSIDQYSASNLDQRVPNLLDLNLDITQSSEDQWIEDQSVPLDMNIDQDLEDDMYIDIDQEVDQGPWHIQEPQNDSPEINRSSASFLHQTEKCLLQHHHHHTLRCM